MAGCLAGQRLLLTGLLGEANACPVRMASLRTARGKARVYDPFVELECIERKLRGPMLVGNCKVRAAENKAI